MRDQLVCVAISKTFMTVTERQREVDIKANWARTRNRFGDQATDIRVNSTLSSFPQSVDPFGPPLLTLDDQQQLHPTTKPPPAPLYRRLAIEPPAPAPPTTTTSARIKEISSTPTMAKDSLVLSEDESDGPNSEIERITNVQGNDDDDDDDDEMKESSRQIASTSNERPKSPFSQLFAAQPTRTTTTTTNGNLPSTKKSDSDDDDDDEFIKMLKRK